MNFVMYFHHQLFPKAPAEYTWKCNRCGRPLFKANTQNITVGNDIGVPWEAYPKGQTLIEFQCHSCKSKYKVLFQ